jgi:hypothetical protein
MLRRKSTGILYKLGAEICQGKTKGIEGYVVGTVRQGVAKNN